LTNIADYRAAYAKILASYKGDRTDWCNHELAVECTAERLNVPQSKVRKLVNRYFDQATMLWSV